MQRVKEVGSRVTKAFMESLEPLRPTIKFVIYEAGSRIKFAKIPEKNNGCEKDMEGRKGRIFLDGNTIKKGEA